MKPYERLEAWKACDELAFATFRITEGFPPRERYGLASQARRAAFSAAANLCEGAARRGSREFRRFIDMAMGSLGELDYTFRLAGRLGLLAEAEAQELESLREHASKITWGLYVAIAKRAASEGVRNGTKNRQSA